MFRLQNELNIYIKVGSDCLSWILLKNSSVSNLQELQIINESKIKITPKKVQILLFFFSVSEVNPCNIISQSFSLLVGSESFMLKKRCFIVSLVKLYIFWDILMHFSSRTVKIIRLMEKWWLIFHRDYRVMVSDLLRLEKNSNYSSCRHFCYCSLDLQLIPLHNSSEHWITEKWILLIFYISLLKIYSTNEFQRVSFIVTSLILEDYFDMILWWYTNGKLWW